MSHYTGSQIEATALRVAKAAGITIYLGVADTEFHSMESGILWTQSRRRRCAYTATRRGVAVANEPNLAVDDQRGHSNVDRWEFVTVTIRAQGGAAELTRLSDQFILAMELVLGSQDERNSVGAWRIESDSSGGGDDPGEGVSEETFTIALRYHVIRDKFETSEGFVIVTPGTLGALGATPETDGDLSNVTVNGPTATEPKERAL